MKERLRRLSSARVVRRVDALLVVHPDGSASELAGDSAALADAVLAFYATPRTRDEVVAHVRALAAGNFDEHVVDDVIALFVEAHVVGVERHEPARRSAPRLRVVLGVTGAIQAVEAPRFVVLLQAAGMDVRVAATKAARRFVSLSALEALTHARVATGLRGPAETPALHIELAEWADVVVVYPASATTLSRLARGDFSSIVSAVALAARGPVVLAPSMNDAMWRAPAVERNIALLQGDGFHVVEPSLGVEVADRPRERRARFGPALRPEGVVDVVRLIAERGGKRREVEDWESFYEESSVEPPWAVRELDENLARELAVRPPPATLLDIGTGFGTVAIRAAELGYAVVATDVARRAIERARARAAGCAITFVRDDILETRLSASFDIAVDRGCMHVLEERSIEAYGASVASLVREGGAFVLVSDGEGADPKRRTLRLRPDELALRWPSFTLDRVEKTTLVPSDPGAAWLSIWTRREHV